MRMFCELGWHRARPVAHWNEGYYFSNCRRCGRDLVRAPFEAWHVPHGYLVVWSKTPPESWVNAKHTLKRTIDDGADPAPLRSSHDHEEVPALDERGGIDAASSGASQIDLASEPANAQGAEIQASQQGAADCATNVLITEVLQLLRKEEQHAGQEGGISPASSEQLDYAAMLSALPQDTEEGIPGPGLPSNHAISTSEAEPPQLDSSLGKQRDVRTIANSNSLQTNSVDQQNELLLTDSVTDAVDEVMLVDHDPSAGAYPKDPPVPSFPLSSDQREGLGTNLDKDAPDSSEVPPGGRENIEMLHDQVVTPTLPRQPPQTPLVWLNAGLGTTLLVILAVVVLYLQSPSEDGDFNLERTEVREEVRELEDGGESIVSAPAEQAFITARLLNCRASPMLRARSVRILSRGDEVRVLAREPGWASVVYKERQCWVADRYISAQLPL